MKLSIIVDNYNYENFVSTAIESALNQTWPDVEVIVVDDGSTDGSRKRIDDFGESITAIYKENGGQGSAFNAAFAQVTGDVVIFLDADDVIDVDTGEVALKAFTNAAHLARVQWPLRTIDTNGEPTGEITPRPTMMPSGDLREHIIRYRTHVWPATSGAAYRKAALDAIFPIPSEFRFGCDLYMAELTALLGTVLSLDQAGGSYRRHGANYWRGAKFDVANLHQRIKWTLDNHANVLAVSNQVGIACPASPLEALDVAFVSQRLASLRLDKSAHPIKNDRRLALTVRGIHAALRHPHHSPKHKAKRVVWLLGVGLGPDRLARRLIERFYFPK